MRNSLVLVFLGATLFCHAQAGFIYRLDTVQDLHGGSGRSIFEVADGYVILAQQVSETQEYTHCMAYKIDQQGHYVWRKDYQEGDTIHGNWGYVDPAFRTDTGSYVGCVSRFGDSHQQGRIFVLDAQGDTVGSSVLYNLFPEDSVSSIVRSIRPGWSVGYLLAGGEARIDDVLPEKAVVWSVNLQGEVEWKWTRGQINMLFEALQVEAYVDGGAVVVGHRWQSFINDDSFLIRLSATGVERWRRYFGAKDAISYQSVKVTPDSGIVVFSGYGEQGSPWADERMMLTKFDSLGTQLWCKKSHMSYAGISTDLEVLPDGSFIATGNYGSQRAFLAKFNSEGDSLWTRFYNCSWVTNIIYDVRPTSDGGFITTGFFDQQLGDDPFPGLYTIWGFKTDSLGCVVPGCESVGVQEYLLDLNEHLRVSPNPASDRVQVQLTLPPGAELQGAVWYTLLDAAGKQIARQRVQRNLNLLTADVPVAQLPSGTYYLHITDATRWLAGSAVVVVH